MSDPIKELKDKLGVTDNNNANITINGIHQTGHGLAVEVEYDEGTLVPLNKGAKAVFIVSNTGQIVGDSDEDDVNVLQKQANVILEMFGVLPDIFVKVS